ncbi:HpcH/HpaI aldolase/citrate lyase family protein [Rhodobacteraceae bacterium NNCM2]|nr:HpcH/HpaI aldolase/citrate lyase family protein [Coraliihabitans acroporae]
MDLPINTFKAALAERKQQIGMWSALSSPVAAEVLANCGYDWVLIDMEHAPNDIPQVILQAQALACGPSPVLVRPAWNDTVLIKRILDIGVQSLIIPFVQNAEEAAAAVAATRYPPAGVRGVAGGSRATQYGRVKNYHHTAADQIAVVVQVETLDTVHQIDKIAAVDGIDALFVGPADLAASMGHLGDINNDAVQAAMTEAVARAHEAGKPIGTLAVDVPVAKRYFEMGYDFIAVGVDAVLFARAADALVKEFR